MPSKMPDDMRTCIFCHQVGDGVADGPSRYGYYIDVCIVIALFGPVHCS